MTTKEDVDLHKLEDTFWEYFEELSTLKKYNFLWFMFGDSICDITKNWDEDNLRDAIEKVKRCKGLRGIKLKR